MSEKDKLDKKKSIKTKKYNISTEGKISRPPIYADNFHITIINGAVSIDAQKFQYHPYESAVENGNLNVQESTEIMTSIQGLLMLKLRVDEIFKKNEKLSSLLSSLEQDGDTE